MHTQIDISKRHEMQLHAMLKDAAYGEPKDYAMLQIVQLPKSKSSMSYFELGDPRGTPLLCLHGLSVTGLFFEQYHNYFVENGIRAIAPSMLGGIHISDSDKTINDLTTELTELMDILEIQRFDVIGFSWGTLPELSLVARFPERVRRAGFLGPMLPIDFLADKEVLQLKSDVRMSLNMAKRAPWLHRALMWLVCRLSVSALVNQFKDENLSEAEAKALETGTLFHQNLSRYINECRRTGSQFFTYGWRMFLDEPGYSLSGLSRAASRVDLRMYVAEQDNVHLPSFAYRIAAICSDNKLHPLAYAVESEGNQDPTQASSIYRKVYSQRNCSIWLATGAGRMACMLYFKEALDNLMSLPQRRQVSKLSFLT